MPRSLASPVPNAFPVQARALSIPMPGHPGLTAVMIDVATSVLTFAEDAKLGTYSADTIVLAQLDSGTPDDVAQAEPAVQDVRQAGTAAAGQSRQSALLQDA